MKAFITILLIVFLATNLYSYDIILKKSWVYQIEKKKVIDGLIKTYKIKVNTKICDKIELMAEEDSIYLLFFTHKNNYSYSVLYKFTSEEIEQVILKLGNKIDMGTDCGFFVTDEHVVIVANHTEFETHGNKIRKISPYMLTK